MTNSIPCICGRTWSRALAFRMRPFQSNNVTRQMHSSKALHKNQPASTDIDYPIESSSVWENAIKEREPNYHGWWTEVMNHRQTPQYSPSSDLLLEEGHVFQGAPSSPSSPLAKTSSSSNEFPQASSNLDPPTADTLGSTTSTAGTGSKLSSPKSGSTMYHGFSIPVKPNPPGAEDCCMSGCVHCVYDIYEEDRQEYKEALAEVLESIKKAGLPPPPNIKTSGVAGTGGGKDDDSDMDPSMKAFLDLEKKLKGS
ncbi:hypothetical protein BGZ76_000888 [Entomortierella beljakovae]|nr:hypothetical protein BGZ76_000888 [Entomortierella beljakovae]